MPVEYVLYPIPVIMSSSGSGGGGWVRSIAKARSLEDMSSPWRREMWRLGMSSVVLYVGDSGAVGEVEGGEEGEGGGGKMEEGGAGSHGAGWQRTVRSSPSPHPASRTWVMASRLRTFSTQIRRWRKSSG